MGRPRAGRLLGAATVALAVVVLALVSPFGAGGSPIAPSTCAEAQTGTGVALVVDFGTVPGSPGGVQHRCVPGVAGRDGIAVLGAAGLSVRFNDAGLLCAIGLPGGAVYPATGCGERTASGYRYWAYFTGTGGGWQYMSVGPGFRKASAAVTEGWHFVEGTGKPGDPPPGGSPDPTTVCPPAPVTTPRPAPPPAPTVTAPKVVTTLPAGDAVLGGATAGGIGGVGGASPAPAAPGDPSTTAPPDPAGGPAAGVGDPTGEVPAAARGTAPGDAGGDGGADGSGSSSPPGTTPGDGGVSELAAVPAGTSTEPGGAPWAVGGVAVVGIGLGAVAFVRMRRGVDA